MRVVRALCLHRNVQGQGDEQGKMKPRETHGRFLRGEQREWIERFAPPPLCARAMGSQAA
jgi:hypothetical protein